MKYLITILLLTQSLFADEITAKVVKVYDGDTVTLSTGDRIRLLDIDTPEIAQPNGKASRDHLRALIFNQVVTVKWSKRDRYKRILGTILHDNQNINMMMIHDGWAWWYHKYSNSKEAEKLQQQAKDSKRGIWKGNPVAPWEYRKRKREIK